MGIEKQGPSPEEMGIVFEEKPVESFENLVSEIKKEVGLKELKEKEQETEEKTLLEQKRREARESIEPLWIEREKIRQEEKFSEGGEYYYALKNDGNGFSRWMNKVRETLIKQEELAAQATDKYEQMTGEKWSNYVGSIRLKTSHLVRERYKKTWSEPTYAPNIEMSRCKDQLSHRVVKTALTLGAVENPEQLINEMNICRNTILSKDYKLKDYEIESIDNAYGFPQVARGVGLAALESGDVIVAAKALAFAENAKKMPPEILIQVKSELTKLSKDKQREFISTYSSEKEKLKEEK